MRAMETEPRNHDLISRGLMKNGGLLHVTLVPLGNKRVWVSEI